MKKNVMMSMMKRMNHKKREKRRFIMNGCPAKNSIVDL
jgi:hypothetical protein